MSVNSLEPMAEASLRWLLQLSHSPISLLLTHSLISSSCLHLSPFYNLTWNLNNFQRKYYFYAILCSPIDGASAERKETTISKTGRAGSERVKGFQGSHTPGIDRTIDLSHFLTFSLTFSLRFGAHVWREIWNIEIPFVPHNYRLAAVLTCII